ncbi:MAG: murein transglycosylase [Formosa sp.]|nr:murein transglycosylase [Formosa sp.]|tara:strand:+ start:4770 stop:5693 length:924 start_codon:yes stop_codon:yes gene_type:complete
MDMSNKYTTYFFLIFIVLFVFIFFSFVTKNHHNLTSSDYNVYALPMPNKLDFSGEIIPLNISDVRERMDRELLVNTYWQSNGFLLFKRAHKYFPIIEPILKSNGIPDDFKYLALIESGLQNVTSPAGAKGFWQIMKTTAKEFGLEVNQNVDERNNLILSTKVACEYLLKAKERFGSWTLAAASYNAGMNGIATELKRQSVDNYYDMLLSQETGRYVFRILALKEITNNPMRYGFNYTDTDLYNHPPTFSVEIDTAVSDLVQFANGFGINYKQLKIHNPWLRETFLNNKSRKKYTIEIPKINGVESKN